jgi:hypothetical protein
MPVDDDQRAKGVVEIAQIEDNPVLGCWISPPAR